MPPGDIESENLAVHVGACRERYKTLFASLDELRRDVRYIRRIGFGVALTIIVKLLAVLGALVVLLWQGQAQAQQPCGKRSDIVAALEREWNERRTGYGVAANGNLIELFRSSTGTWTVLVSTPEGVACLVADGQDWEQDGDVSLHWIDHHAGSSPHNWIQPYKNARGISCCGKWDVAPISHAEANQASIGSKITAEFPSGPLTVEVNVIYPTRDPTGQPWLSKFGCLFRAFGT